MIIRFTDPRHGFTLPPTKLENLQNQFKAGGWEMQRGLLDTRAPPYLFLIDIGLSDDVFGWKPGDPEQPQQASTVGRLK